MSLSPEIPKAGVDLAKELVKSTFIAGISVAKEKRRRLEIDFNNAFSRYLERNYRKICKIKTLINPSSSVNLDSLYEAPNFQIENARLSEDDLIEKAYHLRFLILTGQGGSGKSVFLKHLFIKFYRHAMLKIPIYLEVRNISVDENLIEMLSRQILTKQGSMSVELLTYALEKGKFLFLLDGLDEIDPSKRENVVRYIQDLAYRYDENLYIISSRPDIAFSSWHEFGEASILPFSKSQALSLITKVKYDVKQKEAFWKAVDSGLFDTHETYLSNPLLCIIMLMTYVEGNKIPLKMSLFFEQAFNAMFYRHDSTKGDSYRRKFQSNLEIDEFRTLFSAFSTFAYFDSGSSVPVDKAIELAKRAIEFKGVNTRASDFLNDIVKSLCLMIKDGDRYFYIHRTFQEYFVALFLLTSDFENWRLVIDDLLKNRPNDTVVRIIMELDEGTFYSRYLLEELERFEQDIAAIDLDKTR